MHLTRRAALLSGGLSFGAGLLGACTSRARPRAVRAVDPDAATRDAAVSRELALLAAYDGLLATSPALASRLAPLRAEHVEHLQALGQVPPSAAPSPGAAPLPAPAALVRLRALERSSAEAHASAAVTASRRLAPVLASLAAAEASHAAVL